MSLKIAAVRAALFFIGIAATQAQAESQHMDEAAVLATIDTMTAAFAAGDVDGILTTYETGAIVVGQPGVPVSGDAALREMFEQFIAQGATFTYGAHDVVLAGDVALHLMKWTAPTPNGDVTALSVAVLRKQPDGNWKMVIDQPFGDAVMHAAPAQ